MSEMPQLSTRAVGYGDVLLAFALATGSLMSWIEHDITLFSKQKKAPEYYD
jgi:hypothetical protein